jgi:hypothetical protein
MDDGVSVEVIEVGEDPRFEFVLGCDANAAEYRSSHFGEEALDKIEPGAVLRCEYEVETPLWLGRKP